MSPRPRQVARFIHVLLVCDNSYQFFVRRMEKIPITPIFSFFPSQVWEHNIPAFIPSSSGRGHQLNSLNWYAFATLENTDDSSAYVETGGGFSSVAQTKGDCEWHSWRRLSSPRDARAYNHLLSQPVSPRCLCPPVFLCCCVTGNICHFLTLWHPGHNTGLFRDTPLSSLFGVLQRSFSLHLIIIVPQRLQQSNPDTLQRNSCS